MGYVEVWNAEGDGGWTRLEEIPMIETVPCQLCNEPTLAADIVADLHITEAEIKVGAWQCKKCKAING